MFRLKNNLRRALKLKNPEKTNCMSGLRLLLAEKVNRDPAGIVIEYIRVPSRKHLRVYWMIVRRAYYMASEAVFHHKWAMGMTGYLIKSYERRWAAKALARMARKMNSEYALRQPSILLKLPNMPEWKDDMSDLYFQDEMGEWFRKQRYHCLMLVEYRAE